MLINCPKCGKEVSDQAECCIHCGAELASPEADSEPDEEQPSVMLCPECGEELTAEAKACPRCGCPIDVTSEKGEGSSGGETELQATSVSEDDNAPAPDGDNAPSAGGDNTSSAGSENSPIAEGKKVKGKTLLVVIAVAVVVIAAIAIAFAFNAHQEQVKQEEAAAAAKAAAQQAEADKKAAYNQYVDDVTAAMYLMLTGAVSAEDLGNKARSVWNSAIFDDTEEEWEEDVRKYFSTDFNEALSNMYSDPEIIAKVDELKSNQESVAKIYKSLQNPPDGLESAYSALEEMHDAYSKLTRLAISPSGSLQSYGNEFREADSDALDAYEKLKARIPSKK